ncbi:hypothetical protein QBD00_004587 [Ochrobactrum sp. AN78]|nr:hypothetical protein [Ochrobactrum sp. AN78]
MRGILLAKTQSKESETMKPINLMSIALVMTIAATLSVSSITLAQESGAPNQSGGQEPEVPGTSPSTSQKPVEPKSENPPPMQRERKKEAESKAEKQRKCAPGMDAKACREHGVKK